MLVLNKQVMLSVDANLDQPEARRVTFYTGNNNIFYLELAIDRTEFLKLYDFEPQAQANPDEVMAEAATQRDVAPPPPPDSDTDELLRSLGM
jgi:hypothetical protein